MGTSSEKNNFNNRPAVGTDIDSQFEFDEVKKEDKIIKNNLSAYRKEIIEQEPLNSDVDEQLSDHVIESVKSLAKYN